MLDQNVNFAKLFADKFLKQCSHLDLNSLNGYWGEFAPKVAKFLKSSDVRALHQPAPGLFDQYMNACKKSRLTSMEVDMLASSIVGYGFPDLFFKDSLEDLEEHLQDIIDYHHASCGEWHDDMSASEASEIRRLATDIKQDHEVFYFAFKINLI